MDGIEKITNFGINLYNQKHPEKAKEPFEINPKVRNAIKILSSAAIGIFYYSVTSYHELNQLADGSGLKNVTDIFSNFNAVKPHLQIDQYLADLGGTLAGFGAFQKLEFKDAFWSGMPYAWEAGKAITKPINALENKIKGKNKNTPEKTTTLSVENITIDSEFGKDKESRINPNLQTVKTPVPSLDTTSKTVFEHSSNESILENENEIDL